MKEFLRECLRGAQSEYAEIRWEESRSVYIHYVGHELEALKESREQGGAIRAKDTGGWSFVSFNNPDHLPQHISLAGRQARLVKSDRVVLAPVPRRDCRCKVGGLNEAYDVPLGEKHDVCAHYNRILLDGREIQSSDVRYEDTTSRTYLVTSEGTSIVQERVSTVLGLTAVARRGSNIQSAHEGIGGPGGFARIQGQDELVIRTRRRAEELLDAEPATGGRYTVVIDPRLSGVFAHEAFGHLSEADFLYENERLLNIMHLGRRLGGAHLQIVDDATVEGEGGSYLYDDEGVAAQKTYLIRDGVLVGRLHSRETAAKMGEEPTGNARAVSYQYPPIVRMSNTYIGPGTTRRDELIQSVEHGVYACGFRGGQTNLEMFTFAPEEGYLIEKGKIGTRIRDFNLTGNIFSTLQHIDAVSDDLEFYTGPGGCGKDGQFPLPVSTGGPHIRIRELVIGGR